MLTGGIDSQPVVILRYRRVRGQEPAREENQQAPPGHVHVDGRRLDRVQDEVAGARRGHEHVREEVAHPRRGRDRGRAVVQRDEVDVQLPGHQDCLLGALAEFYQLYLPRPHIFIRRFTMYQRSVDGTGHGAATHLLG